METLIELLDARPADNVLAPQTFSPKRLIYLCGLNTGGGIIKGIRSFIKRRLPQCSVIFLSADMEDQKAIYNKLNRIFRVTGGGTIDITGGGEAAAFAAGMLCAEYRVPVISYDFENRRFKNVKYASFIREELPRPTITIPELFEISGARVEGYGRIPPDEIADWTDTIKAVWGIFLQHISGWTRFTAWLQAAASSAKNAGYPESIRYPASVRRAGKDKLQANIRILRKLNAAGIITNFRYKKPMVSFDFTDPKMSALLSDAGVWLELICWVCCREADFFDDCAASVIVNWMAHEAGKAGTTYNEIDCVAVKWPKSLFISCKLSIPSASALNEIRTLSSRFGGCDTTAVLMTMGDASSEPYFSQRAADLGIRVIDRKTLSYAHQGILSALLRSIASEG